jgi:hypothetical protein
MPSEPSDGGGRSHPLRRTGALAVVVLFCAFVSVPLASLMVGRRAQPIENRTAAPRPDLGLSGWLDTSHGAALNAYLTDRTPYRDTGIRLDAVVDYRGFRDSPNPDVVVGQGDWLFIRESIVGGCDQDATGVVSGMDLLDRMAAAADVPLVIVIPPDKAALYPDRLTDPSRQRFKCAEAFRTELRDALASIPSGASAVAMWDDLEGWVAGTVPKYLPQTDAWKTAPLVYDADTHWTTPAALTGTYASAKALASGQNAIASFDAALDAVERKVEDLRTLIGLPRTVTVPRADLVDEDVVAVRSVDLAETAMQPTAAELGEDQAGSQLDVLKQAGFEVGADPSRVFPIIDGRLERVGQYSEAAPYLARWYQHDGDDLIGGRTVMLGDSFMEVASVNQARVFSDIVMSQWAKLENPWRLEPVVSQADQLVIEAAERRVYETLAPQSPLIRLVIGGLLQRVDAFDVVADPATQIIRMDRTDDGLRAAGADPQILTGPLPGLEPNARRLVVLQVTALDEEGQQVEDEAQVFYAAKQGEFTDSDFLLQPVPASRSTVIFELTGLDATFLRIDPTTGSGGRVTSVKVVDLPPADGGGSTDDAADAGGSANTRPASEVDAAGPVRRQPGSGQVGGGT